MKKQVFFFVVVISALVSSDAFGQRSGTDRTFFCQDCRDLTVDGNWRDARNSAYNWIAGPNAWMSVDIAGAFEVIDSAGNIVSIDTNLEIFNAMLDDLGIDAGVLTFLLEVVLPNSELHMQIRVFLPNGDVHEAIYTITDEPLELPVGEPDTSSDGDGSSGSDTPGGGSSGGSRGDSGRGGGGDGGGSGYTGGPGGPAGRTGGGGDLPTNCEQVGPREMRCTPI